MNELKTVLPLVLPVILLHYTLVAIALINLQKRERVRFNRKWIWVLVIVLIQVFGPILYFLAKGDEE